MPQIVAEIPKASRTPKDSKYPWIEWLDGSVRLFTPEDFGDRKPEAWAASLRNGATLRDHRVKIRVREEGVYMQAVLPPTEPEPAAVSA